MLGAPAISERRPWFFALHLLLSVGLLLATAEVLARAVLPDGWYVWPPHYRADFTADPGILHGISGPSLFRINADGMRGDPMPSRARYRVLTVGASTTICTHLDDAETWPYLLQERLNAALGPDASWVGNVGRPGHTTPQHVLQVAKLLPQHPEIDAVVLLIGIADLLHALIAADGAFQPGPPRPDRKLVRAFAVLPAREAGGPWYSRTGIGRLVTSVAWRNPDLERATILPGARNVAPWRDYRRQAGSLRERLPDLTRPLRVYARRVGAIVDAARANGVRPLFLTQPTLWGEGLSPAERDLLWMEGPPLDRQRAAATYYSVAALAEGMGRYNERLRQVCRERGVDLARRPPRDASVFYDDAHFTEEGARQVAEIVAQHLATTPQLAGAARPH
jgi:lysophospholipase L1-like esterase